MLWCHKLLLWHPTDCDLTTMPLSARMPELASFEVFLTIAETGSLGRAARELGMTQQAVSRRLAYMEAQIGVTLAVRTTRGSELTPAGLIVAEWASRLLEVANEIDAGLGSLRKEGRERIKVAASQTIAEQLMPHWLLSLQAEATRRGGVVAQVVLTATNSEHAIASVRDGTVDLGFVENPGTPKGLGSCVVGQDELVIVVPPGHKWARRCTGGDRSRTRGNPPGRPRTPFGHPRFADGGVASGAGRRHGTGAARAGIDVRRGDARRRARGRGSGGHEPAGGGRRPGGRPAARDHHPGVGLTAQVSRHLGRRAHAARRGDPRPAEPHHESRNSSESRRRRGARPSACS